LRLAITICRSTDSNFLHRREALQRHFVTQRDDTFAMCQPRHNQTRFSAACGCRLSGIVIGNNIALWRDRITERAVLISHQ